MGQLRQYLVEHPGLIWLLGFPLVSCHHKPLGFDPNRSVPTRQHLSKMLRTVPNSSLQFLLDETVRLIRDELLEVAPDFGQVISLDTKHILAWVKENNLNTHVSNRYDKTKKVKGDPDCKLGFKARDNQKRIVSSDPQTPTTSPKPASKQDVGQFYWGYASGVVATKIVGWGEFIIAEFTQPFNEPDVSYFEPLMEITCQRLGFKPRFGAFDAGFDAFYIYEYFYQEDLAWQDGFAAIPFSGRSRRRYQFDDENSLFCEAGLIMTRQRTFMSYTSRVPHEKTVWQCPLSNDEQQECPINHSKWAQGGCTHRIPSSVGVRLRHEIDRESAIYQQVYDQRTATERINARAKSLGIEQPKLRSQMAISNYCTLIYVLVNLRSLQHIQHLKTSF